MTTTKHTSSSSNGAAASAQYRVVNVAIRPRTRAQLALSIADATALIAKSFGAICASVTGVSTRDDAWSATVVVDATKAPATESKVLLANANDERLWKTFIESRYENGTCTVLEMEPVTSTKLDAPRAR